MTQGFVKIIYTGSLGGMSLVREKFLFALFVLLVFSDRNREGTKNRRVKDPSIFHRGNYV